MIVHSAAKGGCIPTEDEADDAANFLARVAAVPLDDIDLEYLAVNLIYGRGSKPKEVKKDAAQAVRTLRVIIRDARRLATEVEPVSVGKQGEARSEPNTTTEQGTER